MWVGFRFAHGCALVPLLRYHAVGLVWVAKGWDVSTTPPRCSFPDDRVAVLKGRCGVDGDKVDQGLGPQRLSALTVTSVAPVVIAKKQVETSWVDRWD